jgi:hypothetical protein
MSQMQDELTISDASDRVAEPRLDAVALPPADAASTFSRRDETTGLLVLTAFAYFIANIAVGQIMRGSVGDVGAAFIMAVIGSQWMLLAIWLGLSNWPLPYRLLSVMFAVAAELLVTFDGDGPPEFWVPVWGGSLAVIATSVPFGLLKLFGLRLVELKMLRVQLDVGTRERPPAIQFSVRNLLSWTASAGIVAALIRGLLPFDARVVVPILIFTAATAALGGVSIWASLSNHNAWPRALAPLVVAVFIGLLLAISDAPAKVAGVFFSATVVGSAAIVVVLLLFRRLGWRIAFRPAIAVPDHQTDRMRA